MSGSKLEEVNKRLLRIRGIGNRTKEDVSRDELNKCIDEMMHEIDCLRESIGKMQSQ